MIELKQTKAEIDDYMRMMTNGRNSEIANDDSTVQHTQQTKSGITPTHANQDKFEDPEIKVASRSKTPIKDFSSKFMAVRGHRYTSEWHQLDKNFKRQTISHSFLLDNDSPNNGLNDPYDQSAVDTKTDKLLPGLYIQNVELKQKQNQKRDRSFNDYAAEQSEKSNQLSSSILNSKETESGQHYGLQTQTNILFKMHPASEYPAVKAVNVTDIFSNTATSKFKKQPTPI